MRLRQEPPDFVLFLVTVILVGIGLIMVFSASAVTASEKVGDAYFFVKRQLIWAAIGFTGMFTAMKLNYEKLRDFGIPALVVAILCLALVMIPGVGRSAGGSTRQLGLGIASFTPSELAKICMALYMASSFSRNAEKLKDFVKGFLPQLGIVALVCLLVVIQPDLGTTFIIGMTAYFMFMVAGARWRDLVLMAVAGAGAVGMAIAFASYRLTRFMAFLNPWEDPSGSGFQIIQSLYALGSGGLFGVGIGQSRQKLFYLPEQHTDFIFAILGEEMGYLGVFVVLTLFFLLAWRGFRIALKAPDSFGCLLAAGLTTMIVGQAVVNLGVVSGLLPVTGIPLPFISFGGSSLIFTLTAVGLLLNVSRYTHYR